jgi:membrane protease YdiL (CAAX protease family)
MNFTIKPSRITFTVFIIVFFALWFSLTGFFKLLGGSDSGGLISISFLLLKSVLFIVFPFLYIRFIRRESMVGFVGFNLSKQLIYRYLLPVIMIVIVSLFLVYLQLLVIDDQVYSLPIIWIGGLLVAPVVEEIAFRGFIFSEGNRLFTAKFNWFLNAILFILIHSSAWIYYPDKDHQILLFSVSTFFFNYVLLFAYTRTKSIYSSMLVHFLNNLLAVLMLA